MELVNAKSREAMAIQDRDEMKVSLDKIRRQQDAQIAREKEWSAKLAELDRMVKAQQEAHSAELARALAAQRQAHDAELARSKAGMAKSRKFSLAPNLEVRTERSNSLWPSPGPSPGDPTTPTKAGSSEEPPNSAGGSWWWQKAVKQRSVSTGSASMS